MSGLLGMFSGLKLIETHLMTVGPFEDWSGVRSRGRAARRRKQGHKQRIRLFYEPDPNVMHDRVNNIIYGHPATLAHLRSTLPNTQEGRE